jgi:hypothetical protein
MRNNAVIRLTARIKKGTLKILLKIPILYRRPENYLTRYFTISWLCPLEETLKWFWANCLENLNEVRIIIHPALIPIEMIDLLKPDNIHFMPRQYCKNGSMAQLVNVIVHMMVTNDKLWMQSIYYPLQLPNRTNTILYASYNCNTMQNYTPL